MAQYGYVGLGMIVIEDYPQPDVKLDYFGGTSGTYAGFDRFDRVVDQKWYDYGASADRYKYGYDRASNRLWRENTLTSGKDEFYTYDGMYQLESAQRGDLTGTPPTGVTSKSFAQQWKTDQAAGLDPTGNWTDFWQDDNGNGTWDLKQSRTHDKANQTTDITEDPGTAWITPVHDAAGNMTTVPKPASLANGMACTYDAWNRLAAVEVSQYLVLRSEYDGLNRRTMKCQDYDVAQVYEYFYHNSSWQVLENRGPSSSNEPEELGAFDQYIWSARYVDAPVLREYSGTRYYYLGDANFNVTTLVDVNGDAREHYQYEPYGKVTILNGATPDTDGAEWTADPNNISDVYNEIRYTGRRYDPETGLYHYRNRPYHAELGRFISRDPIGYSAGDANLYRYVGNAPVSMVDPLGAKGAGHHIIPWEIFGKGDQVSPAVRELWDSADARIWNPHYTFHNGSTLNRVSHWRYNRLVKEELQKFLRQKGKPLKCITVKEARWFVNHIKNMPGGHPIGKFLAGVCREAAAAVRAVRAVRSGRTVWRQAARKGARKGSTKVPILGTVVTIGFFCWDFATSPYDVSDDVLIGPRTDYALEGVLDSVTPLVELAEDILEAEERANDRLKIKDLRQRHEEAWKQTPEVLIEFIE